MEYKDCKFGVAVKVKFLGPTNYRGSRFKVSFVDPNRAGDFMASRTESRDDSKRNGEQPFDMAVAFLRDNVESFFADRKTPLTADIQAVTQCETGPDHYFFVIDYKLEAKQ